MARMIVHNMLGGWGGCQVPGELRVKWYIISRFSIYLANCQRVQCFILMSELMCLIANYLRRFLPPRVLWTSYMADLDPILPLILSGKDVQETPSLRDTKVMPRWPPWDAVTISRGADEQMSRWAGVRPEPVTGTEPEPRQFIFDLCSDWLRLRLAGAGRHVRVGAGVTMWHVIRRAETATGDTTQQPWTSLPAVCRCLTPSNTVR